MQQKQLIWLAGSFLVLLVLAYVSGAFSAEVSTINVPALSISSDQIEAFEIVTSDASVFKLEKKEDAWHITSPVNELADSLTLARFTQNLDDLQLESEVTTNPDKYTTYGVGPAAKHVSITWGRNTRTFYVGNSGPDYQSFYIRLGNDPRVFLSRGRLNLPENIDTWRNKTALNLDTDAVNQIAVASPATTYDILKTGATWLLTEDGDTSEADSTQMASWLTRFAPLTATAFINDLTPADVKANATHQVHFSIPGKATQTIWFLDEEERLAATVSGKNAVFRLTKSQLDAFVPTPENL